MIRSMLTLRIGTPRIVEPIGGLGSHLVIEVVGTQTLELPLEEVAEGYRAMHERRAIMVFLRP